MTAATEPRNTPALPGLSPTLLSRVVGDGQSVFEGCMAFQAGVSATLTSSPGVATFTLGRLEASGVAGDRVPIRRGVFRFDNSSGADEITLDDYGQACFAADNQTVAKSDGGGGRPVAGIVRDVDADGGVWVEF